MRPPPAVPTGRINPAYVSLDALAKYASIGKRTLEKYLADPEHPLPCYRLPGGRKRLVRLREFEEWISAYRALGAAPEIPHVVAKILSRLDSRASG
jgi:hypothetical protein